MMELIKQEGHVTDLITEETVRFIEKKREEPFFIYVPFTAPHIPIDEPQKVAQSLQAYPPKSEDSMPPA